MNTNSSPPAPFSPYFPDTLFYLDNSRQLGRLFSKNINPGLCLALPLDSLPISCLAISLGFQNLVKQQFLSLFLVLKTGKLLSLIQVLLVLLRPRILEAPMALKLFSVRITLLRYCFCVVVLSCVCVYNI